VFPRKYEVVSDRYGLHTSRLTFVKYKNGRHWLTVLVLSHSVSSGKLCPFTMATSIGKPMSVGGRSRLNKTSAG
jgi:hypothetical protein